MSSNYIKVASIERKLFVNDDDKLVEVKVIDNPEEYAKGVRIYNKVAVKGASKGNDIFCVSVEDYHPKSRTSVKDSMTSMLAQGMTPEQIIAKYTGMQ